MEKNKAKSHENSWDREFSLNSASNIQYSISLSLNTLTLSQYHFNMEPQSPFMKNNYVSHSLVSLGISQHLYLYVVVRLTATNDSWKRTSCSQFVQMLRAIVLGRGNIFRFMNHTSYS